MAKRYGVPYGMSKNRIARRLIDYLPPAEVFVDLFAGGCAVAHAALESRKYNHVIINDINPLPTQLFVDAVAGKYRDERRVIDRETFHRLKDSDPYVKYCWSFGAKGDTYLWSEDEEPVKLLACRMIFEDGAARKVLAKEFQSMTSKRFDDELLNWILDAPKWQERRLRFRHYGGRGFGGVHSLERLDGVQEIERGLKTWNISRYSLDYRGVEIPSDAVIYCDIPYEGSVVTDAMCGAFDYDAFYEWAIRQSNIYISSYSLPENLFEGIRGWNRQQSMSDSDNSTKVLEKLFVPRVA